VKAAEPRLLQRASTLRFLAVGQQHVRRRRGTPAVVVAVTMKRQELIAISRDGVRRRTRELLVTLAFAMTWMALLFTYANAILDRFGVAPFIVLAAVPVVVLVAVAIRNVLAMPKCPHCGIRLMGWLLATAVASGNCGHCGTRIEQ